MLGYGKNNWSKKPATLKARIEENDNDEDDYKDIDFAFEKQLKEKDAEIQRLRMQLDSQTMFLQNVIMELINKGVTSVPKVPTIADRLAASKANGNGASSYDASAKPVGKLP